MGTPGQWGVKNHVSRAPPSWCEQGIREGEKKILRSPLGKVCPARPPHTGLGSSLPQGDLRFQLYCLLTMCPGCSCCLLAPPRCWPRAGGRWGRSRASWWGQPGRWWRICRPGWRCTRCLTFIQGVTSAKINGWWLVFVFVPEEKCDKWPLTVGFVPILFASLGSLGGCAK